MTDPVQLADQAGSLSPGRYLIDPEASTTTFRTRHVYGLGTVTGSFDRVEGYLQVGQPVSATTGAFKIDAASFNSNHSRRDGLVKSVKFLHVTEYPTINIELDGLEVHASHGARAVVSVRAHGQEAPVHASLVDLTVEGDTLHAKVTARIDRYAHNVRGSKGLAARYLDVTLALVARQT